MVKSSGDKMRGEGARRTAVEERKKPKGEAGVKGGGKVASEREAENLRAELALERERSRTLEDTSTHVAERLDAAIESVKAILARQG
jgi:hypothetical protein